MNYKAIFIFGEGNIIHKTETEVSFNEYALCSWMIIFQKCIFIVFLILKKQSLMVFLFLDDLNIVHSLNIFYKQNSRSLAYLGHNKLNKHNLLYEIAFQLYNNIWNTIILNVCKDEREMIAIMVSKYISYLCHSLFWSAGINESLSWDLLDAICILPKKHDLKSFV